MVQLAFKSLHLAQHSYYFVSSYFVEYNAEVLFPVQGQRVDGFLVPRSVLAVEGLPPGESGYDPDRPSWSVCSHRQSLLHG